MPFVFVLVTNIMVFPKAKANEEAASVMETVCWRGESWPDPRPTQPSIPPGSVNEYQLRLGRQRQVWFILLVDVRGVCR